MWGAPLCNTFLNLKDWALFGQFELQRINAIQTIDKLDSVNILHNTLKW